MRLGIISDTHGLLRPQVFDVFKEVDHILHGGDVGKSEILTDLEALAPVTAVYGNVDDRELRSRLPQVAEVELDGFAIVVTHGDQFGHPTPHKLHAAFPRAEIGRVRRHELLATPHARLARAPVHLQLELEPPALAHPGAIVPYSGPR